MDNTWSGRIDKVTDVIGMDGLGFNLQLEVKTAGGPPPDFIDITVEIKEPHRGLRGKSSVPQPLSFRVPRHLQTTLYRLQLPAHHFALLMVPEGQREFATVVRANDPKMPATADGGFRAPLLNAGWSLRGKGRQGKSGSSKSGDVGKKEPDAKSLMRAGGLELIEVSVRPQRGLVLQDPKTWGFLRSPADVFFYTGHGMNGNLVTHDPHDTWLTPEELLVCWTQAPLAGRLLFDMDVLIINGCSVLNCDSTTSSGMRWAQLLLNQNGPLYALLGYRGGAPADAKGGHAVAVDMAKRIAGGLDDNWLDYARAWLEVNRANYQETTSPYHLGNACAIDLRGYWVLDSSREIRGPLPLGNAGSF
jgi:hypothetical protein